MKRELFSLALCAVFSLLRAVPNAWINEIHYDNEGLDQNEFVEVVVADPETLSLPDLTLYMYNGRNGEPYCLDCISEFIPGERVGPYQYYTWYQRGIQNDTEGMILVYHDTLVDIIAYEGSFTGTQAPAEGLLFPDVGVAESGSTPPDGSIYLSGLPGSEWRYGTASTPGSGNPGQDLSETMTPVELGYFRAEAGRGYIRLEWQSESETENGNYLLYRDGRRIASLEAAGTSTVPQTYVYKDKDIRPGRTYRYALASIAFDNALRMLDSLRVRAEGACEVTRPFYMAAPFPNPFNPRSSVHIDLFSPAGIELSVLDLKGRKLRTLYRGTCRNGSLDIPVNLRDLPSGRYILACRSGEYREARRITLLK